MKVFYIIILHLLSLSLSFAQEKKVPYLNNFKSYQFQDNTLKIIAENGLITISAYDNDIIKITFFDDHNSKADSSYVVIKAAKNIKQKVEEKADSIYFRTDSLKLIIAKNDFSIKFQKIHGDYLTNNETYFRNDTSHTGLLFSLTKQEAIYGTGSRAIPINRRGYRLENYHQPHYGYQYGEENLNVSIPFFISGNGYGVFFDNKGAGWFDIGKKNKDKFEYSSESGTLSYFLFAGNNDQILQQYTWLTGRQPMPPIWALGFIQSRFGYKSQTETLDIVKRTKAAGYPIDATVLDLFWYGDVKTMGNHNWQRDSFPNPVKMIEELNGLGVKTIPITQTYVTKLSDNYKLAIEKDILAKDAFGKNYVIGNFWAGAASLIDIFKPEAQQYLWNFYKQRINEGVAGWWCDLGEPERHPDSIRHIIGDARSVHSIYPLIWSQLIYNNYRKDFPNQRVFNLARSGGAGMQRYATFPWSGDVSRSWNGLKAQIPIILGMGMSGIGYMHADAGGFAQGIKDPELYARWMQLAAFTPIYRAHADPSPAAPEPIFWDDSTQQIVKKFIKLRYQFLPYNYTLAFENSSTGKPLAMPLNYFDTRKKSLENINDAFMWGSGLLIAPVIEEGKTQRKVIFPKGIWIDFFTGKQYHDSTTVKAKLNQLPFFAKAGSFIPMNKDMGNTMAYTSDTLLVKYFIINDGYRHKYQLFDDDKKDPLSIENKKFELLTFIGYGDDGWQTIETASTKPGTIRDLYYEIVNVKSPKMVYTDVRIKLKRTDNLQKLENLSGYFYYDKKNKLLKIHVKNDGEPSKIHINGLF